MMEVITKLRGTFDSPKSGTGITNDIIADLESDIDNFLKASSESGRNASGDQNKFK